jgi:hypothetical protein
MYIIGYLNRELKARSVVLNLLVAAPNKKIISKIWYFEFRLLELLANTRLRIAGLDNQPIPICDFMSSVSIEQINLNVWH